MRSETGQSPRKPNMALFFWKNNKLIDAYALEIADDLFSYVNPDVAKQHFGGKAKMPKKQALKIEKKLNDLIIRVKRFSTTNSLGIYGKARLQQKLNGRLEELGYPSNVVARISEIVLLQNV